MKERARVNYAVSSPSSKKRESVGDSFRNISLCKERVRVRVCSLQLGNEGIIILLSQREGLG